MQGRNIAALLAIAGIGTARLDASPGYLAVIGPASLRFQEPVRKVRAPEPEPVPVVITVTNVVTVVESKPATEPARPVAPPEPPLSQMISNSIVDFVRGQAPDSQYAPPSVLLRFFTEAPGTGGGTVAIPVGFVPPASQTEPLKSSATYQKDP